ncbi:MAG: hypothetical protein JRG95_25110 [Deltaproteobacteria bacterium]|nr:hypothetical protein [Deltaproteobacteria bacterium]
MIVYGTRATVTAGQGLALACPECEQTTLRGFRVLRYAHLYYIPTLPFGSQPGIECGACFLTRVGAEIPEQLKAAAGAAIREILAGSRSTVRGRRRRISPVSQSR